MIPVAPIASRYDRLGLISGGTSRTFTHDAAGNVTYDARTGVGYGYSYNAAGRLEAFSIDGIRQANAPPERFPILFIAGRAHLQRARPSDFRDG